MPEPLVWVDFALYPIGVWIAFICFLASVEIAKKMQMKWNKYWSWKYRRNNETMRMFWKELLTYESHRTHVKLKSSNTSRRISHCKGFKTTAVLICKQKHYLKSVWQGPSEEGMCGKNITDFPRDIKFEYMSNIILCFETTNKNILIES